MWSGKARRLQVARSSGRYTLGADKGPAVLHVLDTLDMGGKERDALRLARRAIAEGVPAAILLFDRPYSGLDTEYDCEGVPCFFEPRTPGSDLTLSYRIARMAHALGAGIVHAHNETALFYAGLSRIFDLRKQYRVVGTIHTRPSMGRRAGKFLWRTVARLADESVCVSEELSAWLRMEGWIDRAVVIPGGVELSEFQPRCGSPESDSFHIVTVGRLDRVKRQQDIILAVQQLIADGLAVTLTIVGRGPMESALNTMADGHQHIKVAGAVRDVASELARAHAFVLCSEHEGTPLALLEAMAMRLPVIATAVGGVLRMIDDGVHGLIVPVARPDQIAAAIRRLHDSSALRRRLGENARRRAEETYSFEAEWRAYRRIYTGIETSAG